MEKEAKPVSKGEVIYTHHQDHVASVHWIQTDKDKPVGYNK